MSDTKNSPEFDATVGKFPMYTYYGAGCCALRTFHGLGGKQEWDYTQNKRVVSPRPSPAQIIEGIVKSGCGGSTMIFTDAYTSGEALRDLQAFVTEKKLGTLTITPGVANVYTSVVVYTGVLEYNSRNLMAWAKQNVESFKGWERPNTWASNTDKVNMDDVFYNYGGRPHQINAEVA